jgi:hypothetical protein
VVIFGIFFIVLVCWYQEKSGNPSFCRLPFLRPDV